jgi:hypothetical protein
VNMIMNLQSFIKREQFIDNLRDHLASQGLCSLELVTNSMNFLREKINSHYLIR